MSLDREPVSPRVRDRERGQALVLIPTLLVALLAAAAIVVDMGNLYFSYEELVSATQAAAMAAGQGLPQGIATNQAYAYSGWASAPVSTVYNIHPNLNITNVAVNYACVQPTLYSGLGLAACGVFGGQPNANVIQVTETARANTFFARVFGVPYLTINATATASGNGGGLPPYHIMMVLDTTGSMSQGADSDCQTTLTGTITPERCAQYGVQTLLEQLDPCPPTMASCTGYFQPVDQVGLMVFPGLCSDAASGVTSKNCPQLLASAALTNTNMNFTYAPGDYACPEVQPPTTSYNNNPEYLVVPLSYDYRYSDTTNALTGGTHLVNAVGAGTNGCGVGTDPDQNTFYAGVITAAQQYLTANHTSGTQDVMILLSDGDANTTGCNIDHQGVDVGLCGAVTETAGPSAGSVYPPNSACTQAVAAATWAKGVAQSDGTSTKIYSVSYGSETTGCTSGETAPYTTPCATMQAIASTPLSEYFYSVPNAAQAGGTVCGNAAPITQLSQVFTAIGQSLSTGRLVPNGVF